MAEVLLSSAIERLERLVVDESVPLGGAKKQVKDLRNDLRMALDSLKHSSLSSKILGEGSLHYHWMSQLLDMAHEADVAIDLFIFRLQSPTREKGHHLINNIRIQIDAISEKIQHIQRHVCPESYPMRSTSFQPHGSDPYVVGLDKHVESLLRNVMCNNSAQGASATCIVGMGGVGKTTLARLLYNHQRVASEFPCRAWIHVSSEFNEEKILRELIRLVGMEYEETEETESLREIVAEHLRGTRYFIVLDDVWKDEDLMPFMSVFRHQDTTSRLVLTSRTRNIIPHNAHIHEMKILDRNESWELFLMKVFIEKYTKCPNHLEEIGRKIVAKCNGLPLAIVVVGSQLSNKKHSEREWENFLISMDLSGVLAVLELSYHKLPPILKSCFLRLGFFKEGTTIRVEKLVHFWTTAGGMLSQGEAKYETEEEIARKYLDELINQYMVEVKDLSRRDNSRVKNCYINSNLHRLAVAKAEEEIRFEVLRADGNIRAPHQPRHGVINYSRGKFSYSTNQVEQLASVFFRGGANFDVCPSYWKSFELLTTLDFEGFGLKALPEMVGKFLCLRYLGLRNNLLRELPRSLGCLRRLEVLDFAQNFVLKVPDMIRKMDSLRHLYMSDIICWEALKIDSLKYLHTLTYVSVDDWIYEISRLEMMKGLRKLGIEEVNEMSDISEVLASLSKLENLDCLILRGSRFRSMPSLDELHILHRLTQLKLNGVLSLPSHYCFPPNIRYLTLINARLNEDPMPVLEKLFKLVFLELRNTFTGEQMVVSECGFAELRALCIGEMWNLRNLQVGERAMQYLERVEINNCPYLNTLPIEIGSMASMEQ